RDDGAALRDLLVAGVAVTLPLDAHRRVPHPEVADAMGPWSSRGPARGAGLKPELTAPGATISSARLGGGVLAIPGAGTSLAAPHVAGAAALIIALADGAGKPRPAPEDVARILVATTAATVVNDAQSGTAAPVTRAGSGRLDAWAAVRSTTALAAPSLAGLDFGHRIVTDDLAAELPLTIQNRGASDRHYRLTVRPRTNAEGAIQVSTSPAGVLTVPGGETVAVDVVLAAEAAALASGPGVPRGGRGVGSGASLAHVEYDGRLEVEEVAPGGAPLPGGDRLHVPFYIWPEAVSRISVPGEPLSLRGRGSLGAAEVTFTNLGPAAGAVEAFTWVGDDPLEATVNPKVDVRHVGVRPGRDAAGEAILEFALTFAGPHEVPPEVAALVYLDVDLRGGLDWLVVGVDAQHLATGEFSGQWLTLAVPYPDGAAVPDWSRAVPQYYGDVRLGGRYVVLPVSSATLGLPQEGARFQFFVSTEDRLWAGAHPERGDVAPGGVGLQAPVAEWLYDARRPRYEVWPWTSQVPAGGQTHLRVASRAGPTSPAAPGVLLVYPGNRQAEPGVVAQTLRLKASDLGGPVWEAWLPRAIHGRPRQTGSLAP
ncbi:MAG: S8 family serine peptidase, partial [Anaerolineae bacterium]